MWLELSGVIEHFEGAYRARVHLIGVHAYGENADEAQRNALRMTEIKLGIWEDAGVFDDVVVELRIPHSYEAPDWAVAELLLPRPKARLELSSA